LNEYLEKISPEEYLDILGSKGWELVSKNVRVGKEQSSEDYAFKRPVE
jgi:hypothetical protein